MVGCPLPTPSPGSVVPLKKCGKVLTCSELVCVPLHPRRMFGACNLWGAPSLAPPPGGGSPESVGRKTARSHPKLKSILECQRGSLIQFAFSGQPLSFCWPLGPRGGGGGEGKHNHEPNCPSRVRHMVFQRFWILGSRLGPLVGNWAGV